MGVDPTYFLERVGGEDRFYPWGYPDEPPPLSGLEDLLAGPGEVLRALDFIRALWRGGRVTRRPGLCHDRATAFARAAPKPRVGDRVSKHRRTTFRHAVLAIGVSLALLAGAPAAADDIEIAGDRPNVGEMIFDGLILRPLGTAATVGGFGVFVLTAPFLAPSMEIPYGWDTFVIGPADYTFRRPFGEW